MREDIPYTPEEVNKIKNESDSTFLKQSFDLDSNKGNFRIAEHLVKTYHIKTIGEREREIYIYEDGIYQPGINFIRKWLHFLLEERCKTHTKKEILEKVKDLTAVDRALFTVESNFINLNNGVLDLEKLTLLPHNPAHLFFSKIPVDYKPQAECPNIKKFLSEILDNESIQTFQEFIGFGLYRRYFIKKALILVGERNTGKTTLLKIISSLFGAPNVSGVSLQKITSDKFSAAHLYQKHINTFDDLSFKDINDTGAFKIATGGGSITAEYKFGNQFQFENYAKLIFACNKIPDVKDTEDDAYFSRWIVLRFNREVEKVDNFLIDKLTTPEELSGLLNFAIEGLKRLLKNEAFSYQKEPDEIKDEMMRSGSSVASFVATCLCSDSNSWVSKDDLYSAFCEYAIENQLTVITKVHFGKKIAQYASYILDGKKTIGKKQETGWRNVKIKNSKSVIDDLWPSDLKEEGVSTDSMDFNNL